VAAPPFASSIFLCHAAFLSNPVCLYMAYALVYLT
jgi:hypothetical protein